MKTKCPECGKRYSGPHPKAACQLWAATRPRNKYGAEASDGFPSKLERSAYGKLLLRERAGEIRDLERYPSVDLGFGIRWKVDFKFTYTKTNSPGWAEAKGAWTADALLKLRMWKNGAGPGPLEIWRDCRGDAQLTETIIPTEQKKEGLN